MNTKFKSALSWLLAPSAIGIYLTLTLSILCFQYYRYRDGGIRDVPWINLIQRAHQNSIDFRLQSRGPQKGSDKVALLVVDEKAVEAVGRWPWPREVLAQAIDNAFKAGAKVLAFDMVFSEPTNNVGQEIYDKLRSTKQLSPDLEKTLQGEITRLDNDQALANVYAKYADKIVAGSAYLEGIDNPQDPGYLDFCFDLAFKQTPAASLWDHEEVLISPQDPYQPQVPSKLTELFATVLKAREQAMRQEFAAMTSKKEQVELGFKVDADLEQMCHTILDDYKEEINSLWKSEVLTTENPKEFKFPTYDDWLQSFKSRASINSIPVGTHWTMDITKVSEKTKHTAFFNADLDSDGTIRSNHLIVRTGKTYFPSLGLKAYLLATQQNAAVTMDVNAATGRREIKEFNIADNDSGNTVFKVPTDGQGSLLINYAGKQKMFPHLSLAELLSPGDDAEIDITSKDEKTGKWTTTQEKIKKSTWLRDKIFIVGATAVGIYDLRVTPFEENYPGVETHANVVSNLLNRRFLRNWDEERAKMPVVLLVVGFVLSLLLAQLGALGGLAVTSSFIAVFVILDKFYLFDHGVVVTIIWPLMLIAVVFITLTFYRYFTEERGKKELRQTFAKYVSPSIVEEILSDPKNIELGGRKVNLTVMFSDVRGFTTISEKLDPRALSDLLNSYLTPMTELVFKNRGTLDKYMGDAIMAFFGAPIGYPDHAKHACRCALQSLEKLFELQKEYEKKGLPTIDIGIGLNSGEVSVGNMGSETVRSYTVMGDAVNLASRLEGINKQYGTRIIISEFTHEQVKDSFICREVDWVRVKGKVLPVKIFELIAEKKVSARAVELLKHFQEGYERYHEKAWSPALDAFTKALNLQPDDEVAKLYVTRCQEYLVEPPPDDWDGVFTMKTK
jgi:adenylate cyclase